MQNPVHHEPVLRTGHQTAFGVFLLRKKRSAQKLCIVVLYLSGMITAQNDTFYFKHFNVDNGLSHRNVSSIIQDSLGFMWYGTAEGLSMFDGYSFLPFKHDPKNPNSLISDEITCLATEKKGLIWIGTRNKGLNRYNSYSGTYDVFQHDNNNPASISDNNITSIFCDSIHGLVWIGTVNGLNAFDAQSGKFKILQHQPGSGSSLSNSHVTCIKMDKNKILWIGTEGGGVNILDYSTGMISTLLHDKNNHNSISSDRVKDLFIDKQNVIWIATSNGLNEYDTQTGKFTVFRHNAKDPSSISSDDLTSVYQDKYGKIWVGTANDGLSVFYPKSGKFILYSYDKKGLNSLSSNKINSVSQGRSGMFWAATSNGGLNAFNPKTLKFNVFEPVSKNDKENIYEDLNEIALMKNNFLVMCTRTHGLYVYDIRQKTIRNFTKGPGKHSIPGNNVTCILADGNEVLLGVNDRLIRFNPGNNFFDAVEADKSGHAPGIPDNVITTLYRDSSGAIWIGTSKTGVRVFDPDKHKTRYLSVENGLCNNYVTSILEDKKGNMWIGTCEGLNKLNLRTSDIKVYKRENRSKNPISSNFINKIFSDSKGELWITTKGGGLNRYVSDADGFRCFTTDDGLPGNYIGNIIQDKNLNYWIGSDYGICRLTFAGDRLTQCRIFDLVDGLPTTEFCETRSAYGFAGRMIFSSNKGFITFNPDSIRNNQYKPPVVISGFHLFNKLVQPNDSTGLLKTSISVTKEILLDYSQNSFSFDFTAISFINSGKNRYAYKLEGFDKDWNYRNSLNRNANYTNIDPGKYTFRVIASNNDGVWNEKGTSLDLIIAAPFWKKGWFYTLCVAGFLLIMYGFYYLRLQNVVRMQSVRNKISRDLHDQIGSTLCSISIYSEVAKTMVSQQVPEAVPVLDGLGESARLSIESMSDIVWAINPSNDKFHNIIERLQLIATQLLEAKNIKLEFDVPESLNDAKLSMQQRKNLYLILKEAINNVAKYSEARVCTVKGERNDRKVNIKVNDDGVGFSGEEKTLGGNGIINMKQRARELNGILQIFSEKQKGTRLLLEFRL